MLDGLSDEQVKQLLQQDHPFFLENRYLLGDEEIDPIREASTPFTIHDEMRETFLYLNQGNYKAALLDSTPLGFKVVTPETTMVFEAEQATEWVSLLNQLAN